MLSPGENFAGYMVLRLLGAGGMGKVYLAQHPRLARQDALKVLSLQLSADGDFAERFRREANLTASLWHPHIVGVHDAGQDRGRLWLSMDYVEGIDAARLLKEYPRGLPVADALDIVAAVAEALDFAHQRGLLHRDVKPANILLTTPETGFRRILLADFGIARHADDISGLTATNMTLGTVSYSAPEQLMGEDIDGHADQYALAATAYHLLAAVPVFEHSNPAVVISRHLSATPPPVSQARPELAALDEVFVRALAKNPTDRFDRCAEFADSLRRAVVGPPTTLAPAQSPAASARNPMDSAAPQAPTQAAAVSTQTPASTRPQRRGSWRTVVFGGAAAVVIVVALVVALGMIPGPRATTTSSTTTTLTTNAGNAPLSPRVSAPTAAPIPLPPKISEAGKIIVGTNVPYAPAEFRSTDGTLVGFDVDLIQAVAAELGVTAEIREFDFSKIIPAVMSGEIDVGMASMTDTKQREYYVDMVNYFAAGTLWAQRAGEPAINPNAACGLRVAVQDTTTQQTDELPARSRACVAAGLPPVQIVSFYSQDQAFNAVVAGDADAASADSPVSAYGIKTSGGRLVAAGDMFDVAPYGWPVAKGSSLAPALQQALQRTIDNGRYTRLLTPWGVERGALHTATINNGI